MKTFFELQYHLSDIHEEVEAFRVKKYRNTIIRRILFAFSLIPVFYFTIKMLLRVGTLPIFFVFMVFIAGCLLWFFIYLNDNEQQYREEFKEKLFRPLVQMINPDLKYEAESHLPVEILMESNLFPKFNSISKKERRVVGEDLFEGQKENTRFKFSEISIGHERYFGKGLYDFDMIAFQGVFMVLEDDTWNFPDVYVLPKSENVLAKKPAPTFADKPLKEFPYYPVFNELFSIYAEPKDAKKVFSEAAIHIVTNLQAQWGSPVFIRFGGNKIYIGLTYGEDDMFEVQLSETILDGDEVENLYNSLENCFNTVDEFMVKSFH